MEFPVALLWGIWSISLKSMEGLGIFTSLRRNIARRTEDLLSSDSWTNVMLKMPWIL